MEHDISGILVVDELRAVQPAAACLPEAAHRAPASPVAALSARVPIGAVGINRSEDEEMQLVAETGEVGRACALSKEALSGIGEGLDATSSMRGDLPARHPLTRRHDA